MMTKQEAIEFCKNNPESAADTILMVEELKAIIASQNIEIENLKRVIKDQEIIINKQAKRINELEAIVSQQAKRLNKQDLIITKQEERIKELETKLNMNSSNSSKPPSTDNKLKIAKKRNQIKNEVDKKEGLVKI